MLPSWPTAMPLPRHEFRYSASGADIARDQFALLDVERGLFCRTPLMVPMLAQGFTLVLDTGFRAFEFDDIAHGQFLQLQYQSG